MHSSCNGLQLAIVLQVSCTIPTKSNNRFTHQSLQLASYVHNLPALIGELDKFAKIYSAKCVFIVNLLKFQPSKVSHYTVTTKTDPFTAVF